MTHKTVDLRSDTVTQPTPAMRAARKLAQRVRAFYGRNGAA